MHTRVRCIPFNEISVDGTGDFTKDNCDDLVDPFELAVHNKREVLERIIQI